MKHRTRYVHCQHCYAEGKPFRTYIKFSECPICGNQVGSAVVRDTDVAPIICRDWSRINENRDTVETGVYTGLGDNNHVRVSTKRDLEKAHDDYNRRNERNEEYVRPLY